MRYDFHDYDEARCNPGGLGGAITADSALLHANVYASWFVLDTLTCDHLQPSILVKNNPLLDIPFSPLTRSASACRATPAA